MLRLLLWHIRASDEMKWMLDIASAFFRTTEFKILRDLVLIAHIVGDQQNDRVESRKVTIAIYIIRRTKLSIPFAQL